MKLVTPDFWKTKNVLSLLLFPSSYIYYLLLRIREVKSVRFAVSKPVICIGNVTIGGSGKTPMAMSIASMLLEVGFKIVFVSKGYGGTISAPTKVNIKKHSASEVGDEPLLLAQIAPTYVCKNRKLGIAMAMQEAVDFIIMDDGLQNPTISKDISILVIDGMIGVGNGFMIPAGPMREPLRKVLKRVDATIVIGIDAVNITSRLQKQFFTATKITDIPSELEHQNIIAFTGIAYPEKFFATIQRSNCNLLNTVSYPDHYQYKQEDLDYLFNMAKNHNACLITTEKDWVRIDKKQRKKIYTVPMQVVLSPQHKTQLMELIFQRIRDKNR